MNITTEQIQKVLAAYMPVHADMSRRQNYYEGKHSILRMSETNTDGSEKNKVMSNFCRYIVDMHVGAITSIPFQYVLKGSDQDTSSLTNLAPIIEENDLHTIDTEHLKTALSMGYSVEVHSYQNGRIVITQHDPREWAFVFDTDGKIQVGIRRVELNPFTMHEGELLTQKTTLFTVYDDKTITDYKLNKDGSLSATGKPTEHRYGRVPIVLFKATKDTQPFLTDSLINQNDVFNKVFSAAVDDIDYGVDSLLVLKGYDPDMAIQQIDTLKKKRVIPLAENGEAEFITKGNDIEKIRFLLDQSREAIHMQGVVPDINTIVGATGEASGIALKLKFLPMQEQSGHFIKYLKQSLRDRIDLINAVWSKLNIPVLENYDIIIQFNLPINNIEIWEKIGSLRGLVSHRTMLTLIPDITDPEAELEAMAQERSTLPQEKTSLSPLAIHPSESPEVQAAKKEAVVSARAQEVTNSVASLLKGMVKPIPKDELQAFAAKARN